MIVKFFTAPYCAPCRQLKPIYDQLTGATVEYIDVSVNVAEAQRYGVLFTPDIYICKDNGEVIRRLDSFVDKQRIQDIINEMNANANNTANTEKTNYLPMFGIAVLLAALFFGNKNTK